MKGERTFGDDRVKDDLEELDTFNIIFVNIGNFEDGLPDALAIGWPCSRRWGRRSAGNW